MTRPEPRPGNGPPRPRLDAGLRGLARFVLGLIFREISLTNPEHLPETGPVLLIANHSNSIIDGAILLAALPRIPRFLAASTVWDYKPVAPFMDASGAVKIYRQQDGRAHEGTLQDSFTDAAALLNAGGVLAIFPEGRTHDAPTLLPFKTGAARIARFAETQHGQIGLKIVPLGVAYEDKSRLRSRATFTFGAPLTLAAPTSLPSEPAQMRGETQRFQAALSAVAPDFADADAARALTLGAEILTQSDPAPPYREIVATRSALARSLASSETGHATRHALDTYGAALDAAGVTDADLTYARPPGVRALLALVPGLPAALVTAILCGPQAFALHWVSRGQPRDRRLTWKLFGGVVLYPLTWALWGLVAGTLIGAKAGPTAGWVSGLALVALAPVLARVSIPFFDRAAALWRRARARRRLAGDPALAKDLARLRAAAKTALDSLPTL